MARGAAQPLMDNKQGSRTSESTEIMLAYPMKDHEEHAESPEEEEDS
jgi:hypothetical protein